MAREFQSAECHAAMVFQSHGDEIHAAVYILGQSAVSETLHALAQLIEESEFTFTAERMH